MSKTKKIAILAIIAMVLTLMPTALFAATADSTRLEGAGRVETALDIASAGWTTASTVVLAPADQANLVDALAAAPLAGQANAPILLTFKGSLDAAVKAKITALGATKVYVIGAVSDAVAAEVDAIANVTVEKLAGADRWATADAVNAKLTSPAGTFVVGYDAIADALSASSYAAKNKFAIVLAKADGTVDSAKLVGATKYIVGGTTKVKDIAGVTRISGADRYATNADVASKLSFSYDRVYVANGVSLVDALAVAPLAAKYNAFVALASSSDVAAKSVVNGKLLSSSKVIAVGGANAVSDSVKGTIAYSATTFDVESLEIVNAQKIKVTFTKPASPDTTGAGAKNPANYTFNGTALSALAPAVVAGDIVKSDDNKTYTINLGKTALITMSNDTYYTFGVKDVKDVDLVSKIPTYAKVIKFNDTTSPVASLSYNSSAVVKISFSEEMNFVPANVTKIYDNNNDAVTPVATGFVISNLSDDKKSFTIAMGSDVVNNLDYTVKITGAADYVGNVVSPNPSVFTVKKTVAETVKPTVTAIESIGNSKVKVTFSEELSAPGSINCAGAGAMAIDTTGDDANTTVDGLVYTITLNAANATAVKTGGIFNVELTNFTDMNGNTQASSTKAANFEADNAGPKYVGYTLKDIGGTKYVVVEFDDNVNTVVPANTTATYTNADGVETAGVAVTLVANADKYNPTGAPDTKFIKIAYASFANGSGKYRFDLPAGLVTDKVANGSKATDVTFVIGTASVDSTVPRVADYTGVDGVAFTNGYSVQVANNDTVYVKFTEKMDTTATLDVNNYLIDGVVAAKNVVFTDADRDIVKITLVDGAVSTNGSHVFAVKGVKDEAGNLITTVSKNLTFTENGKPTLTKAELITSTKIKLTFSEALDPATIATVAGAAADKTAADLDFVVKAGTETLTLAATLTVNQDTTKVYVINLAGALTADQFAKVLTVEIKDTRDITDDTGNAFDNKIGTATITVSK